MSNNDQHRPSFTRWRNDREQGSSEGSKKKDEVVLPFPSKPVIHRRTPMTKVRLGLDFQTMYISAKQTGDFFLKEYDSNVSGNTTESNKSPPRMASAELGLQQKLGKVDKSIRKTMKNDTGDPKKGVVFKRRDERQCSEEKAKKVSVSDQAGEVEAAWHDTLTVPRNQADSSAENRMRKTFKAQQARWALSKQGINIISAKTTQPKANEPIERKTEGVKLYKMKEKTGGKYSKQNNASLHLTAGKREMRYKEMPHNNHNGSDDKQKTHQNALYNPVHRISQETQRRNDNILSTESDPRLVSDISQRSLKQQQATATDGLMDDESFQLLPCRICNRMMRSERVETHTRICKNITRSRPVFNMSAYRMKGTSLEEYWKTHTKSESPELEKKKKQHHKER